MVDALDSDKRWFEARIVDAREGSSGGSEVKVHGRRKTNHTCFEPYCYATSIDVHVTVQGIFPEFEFTCLLSHYLFVIFVALIYFIFCHEITQVHYLGWTSKWDAWIARASPDLQPLHGRGTRWRDLLRAEDWVEVSDKALGPDRRNAWHLAVVLEVRVKNKTMWFKVTYICMNTSFRVSILVLSKLPSFIAASTSLCCHARSFLSVLTFFLPSVLLHTCTPIPPPRSRSRLSM